MIFYWVFIFIAADETFTVNLFIKGHHNVKITCAPCTPCALSLIGNSNCTTTLTGGLNTRCVRMKWKAHYVESLKMRIFENENQWKAHNVEQTFVVVGDSIGTADRCFFAQ